MQKKNNWHLVILFLMVVLSSWSLFSTKFFRTHDYIHGTRIVEMLLAVSDGHFPVRWSSDLGYGFGMPLFEFYAPLPYYFGALIYWLGFSLVTSVKTLFLIPAVVTAWGSYLLGKEMFSKKSGLIMAAILTLAPYRAVNLYVRGAVSEAWGMMVMPMIVLFSLRLLSKKKGSRITSIQLILSLVILMLSHNLTTLMFVPVSIGFVLVWSFAKGYLSNFYQGLRKVTGLFLSYLLAIGLSSFYLIPALLEKDFTQIEKILGGYFHYSQHFLYLRQFVLPGWGYGGSVWGPEDDISFFLGAGQLLGLLLFLFLFINLLIKFSKALLRNKDKREIEKIFLWLMPPATLAVFFGLSLYMSLLKSQWLWQALPLVEFIQFPWRWLAVATLFLACLGGWSLKHLFKLVKVEKLQLVVLFGWLILLSINAIYFRPEKYLDDAGTFYYHDRKRISREMSGILPDFIPIQMGSQEDLLSIITDESGLLFCNDKSNCDYQVEVIINRVQEKLFRIELQDSEMIQLKIADFPGMRAEIDGKPTDIHISELGNISLLVPEGQHSVAIWFGGTIVRNTADVISLISLLILLIWSSPSSLLLSKIQSNSHE